MDLNKIGIVGKLKSFGNSFRRGFKGNCKRIKDIKKGMEDADKLIEIKVGLEKKRNFLFFFNEYRRILLNQSL